MSVAKRVSAPAFPPQLSYRLENVASVPPLADFSFARRSPLVSRDVFADVVRLADFASVVISGLLIAVVYVDEALETHALGYLAAAAATGMVLVALFDWLQLYQVSRFASLATQLPRIFLGWAAALAVLAAGVFF